MSNWVSVYTTQISHRAEIVKAILEEGMLEHCREVGDYFLLKLKELGKKHAFVRDVRGRGLILGMELSMDGGPIVKQMMEKGILINCTMGNVLRFLPPLIVTKGEVDEVIAALEDVFKKN